jgi:hypothetical protein
MKKIPKGRTPSLIGSSNGRPSVVVAQRKCQCTRCSDDILGGTRCFDIPKTGTGFSRKKRYCEDCYRRIIEQTTVDLDLIRAELL